MSKRRYDGVTYSVFIAGADDCDDLRRVAKNVFSIFETPEGGKPLKFAVFDWKDGKRADHTGGEFQDEIFEDAKKFWGKETCDILVLNLWHKLGKDTKREYDHYMTQVIKPRLYVCHYNEKVSPLDLINSKIDSLFKWIKLPRRDWAEISTERGTVEDTVKYQQSLGARINGFLEEEVP